MQFRPPLVQLEDISSCPVACHLGEMTKSHLTIPSCQGVMQCSEIRPEPPFLQTKPLPCSLSCFE